MGVGEREREEEGHVCMDREGGVEDRGWVWERERGRRRDMYVWIERVE